MQNKLSIFVIMPFGDHFDLIYRHLIKYPLEAEGHIVARADDDSGHQSIIKEIIQGIWQADLIIADLTGRNANVYYELGIAHSLKKPTIQIAQSLDDILFNLRSYNAEPYSINSDGSSDLADLICGIIKRDNYNFSNPVNDFINTRPEKITIIPRSSNDIDDGVDDSEEVTSDDSDYGLLDAGADVEVALDEIVSITEKIGLDISIIGDKARAHTEEVNKLASNPNQQGIHSKKLLIMRRFASDMNEFSGNVNQKTPVLKEAWVKLDQGLGHTLLVKNIENQPDYETALSLLETMNNIQNTQNGAIKSVESFRDSHENLIGLSRASNRAVRNSVKTIDKLLDEFKLGDSVLTRLIDLATDVIDRYEGDMPSNGDDDST